MALERLALPSSTSAGPEISVPDASVEPAIAADRFDHPDNLYQELSRGGPVFVQALLDVAIDVMDVRRDWKSEQFAPVEQPAPNYKQLVEEVYSSNYHQLVRLAILFVHDREAAEDMVQSSFEEILGVSSKARDAQEILINSRRVIINRARSPLRMTQDHARDLTPVHIGGDAPGIEDYVVDRSDIAAAMRLLPRRQSEVIALRYYGDYAEVEIAEVLGISRGSVKSQLARGLVALREIMRTTS
jgi:RNA polymerase sigma factor (sigma-70 family)